MLQVGNQTPVGGSRAVSDDADDERRDGWRDKYGRTEDKRQQLAATRCLGGINFVAWPVV